MLAAGLERQLRRPDLPAPVVKELEGAQQQLWRVIAAAKNMANSELWTWRYEAGVGTTGARPGASRGTGPSASGARPGVSGGAGAGVSRGKYVIAPFGGSNADADESNAAQLWSTVYLAIWPPGELPAVREKGGALQ
jgi:hypothetical protein